MRRLIFLGERQIAWDALIEITKPVNRDHMEIVALVCNLATNAKFRAQVAGIEPVFIPNDRRRTDEILSAIKTSGATGLISVQHNWILSQEIIEAVDGWAFNLHNARLPHYQGYNSISHAIINGDRDFVSTIHWMAAEVDTGDIAYEEVTPIDATDTAVTLHRKTIKAAARAFERLLDDVRSDRPVPRNSSPDVESRFYGKNDLKPLLDVSAETDPEKLDRLVRGLFYPPYNAAYRVLGRQRVYQIPGAGLGDLVKVGLT